MRIIKGKVAAFAFALSLGAQSAASAQEPEIADCRLRKEQVPAVRAAVGAGFVGGNVILLRYFKNAWWSGERSDGFFFKADWDQPFRDQDKLGHMWGGYHLAQTGYEALRAACVSPRKARLASAVYAAAFQLQIEIFDGQFEKYGFSYPDLIANSAGTALALAHQTWPGTQAVKPTFSYARTLALRNRDRYPSELRPSLDYSGQTYWLSFDVERMMPEQAKPLWPSFVRLSAGHSITDWIDPQTGATMRAKRRILLSLDLDPSKLPGEHPLWKAVKNKLSYYHFPSPALQIAPDVKGIAWYR